MPFPIADVALETPSPEAPKPRRRGFAGMDPERVRALASKGGRAAHVAGTAHQFSSDEARKAGVKGGTAPHVRRGRGPRRDPSSEPKLAPETQEKLPLTEES